MTKLKTKLLTKLLSGFIAFVFAISLFPLASVSNLIKGNASSSISLPNSSFENPGNASSDPSAWTSKIITETNPNNSTMGGRIKTDPVSWISTMQEWITKWVNSWKVENKNLRFFELNNRTDESSTTISYDDIEFSRSNTIVYDSKTFAFDTATNTYYFGQDLYFIVYEIDAIAENLKSTLFEKIPATPLVKGYDHTSDDNKEMYVLMMFSGYKVKATDHKTFELPSNDIFYTFTQTTNASLIKLDDFGFYKASVWVNTFGDARASFNIEGVELSRNFEQIQTSNMSKTKTYYTYKYYNNSSDTNPISFVSDIAPALNASVSYGNKSYTYNAFSTSKDSTAVPSTGDSFVKYDNIVESDSDWVEYSIYFSTKDATTIKFVLGLGNDTESSNGYAFFDDVTLSKITYEEYSEIFDVTHNDGSQTSNLSVSDITNIISDNKLIYNNTNYYFDLSSDTYISDSGEVINLNLKENCILGNSERNLLIKNNFDSESNLFNFTSERNGTDLTITSEKTMLIDHYNTGNVSLTSNTFSLDAMKFYRVSIWMKPQTASLAFTLTLNADMQGKPSKTQTISINSSTNDKWNEYSFFVIGNAFKTTDLSLTINLTKAGKIEVDNLSVETIRYDNYSTSTSANKLPLNTNSQTETVTNGHFNSYVSVDENSNILPPTGWFYIADAFKLYSDSTKTTLSEVDQSLITEFLADSKLIYNSNVYLYNNSDNCYYYQNTTSGKTEKFVLIRNQEFIYNHSKKAYFNSDTLNKLKAFENIETSITSDFVEAGTLPEFDVFKNVLRISSKQGNKFSLRSSKITITKSSYFWINFYSAITNGKTGFASITDAEGNTYAEFSITGEWKQYGAYVRGTATDKTLYLNIGIDATTDSSDNIYFANIKRTASSDATTNSKLKLSISEMQDSNSRIIDLSKNSFTEHSYVADNSTDLHQAFLINKSPQSTGITGIVDTLGDNRYKSAFGENFTSFSDSVSRALLIQNQANQKTSISPTIKENLVSGNYYSISMIVKTLDIKQSTKFSISLTANSETKVINEVFENINTSITGDDEFNGYAVYTLYISTGTNSFNNLAFEITLDGEGTVLIGQYSVSTVEKDAFNKSIAESNNQTKVVNFTTASVEKDKDEKKEDKDTKDNNSVMLFFIVFSSILLVAAVVLALVFVGMKKLPKRKKIKINKKVKTPDSERGFV